MGVGWNLGAINFKIDSTLSVKDCSKVIFYDMKSSWTGDNAKWLEDCVDSDSATAVIMDRSYPSVTDQLVVGGKAIDGPGCFKFALWTEWAPYVAQYAM